MFLPISAACRLHLGDAVPEHLWGHNVREPAVPVFGCSSFGGCLAVVLTISLKVETSGAGSAPYSDGRMRFRQGLWLHSDTLELKEAPIIVGLRFCPEVLDYFYALISPLSTLFYFESEGFELLGKLTAKSYGENTPTFGKDVQSALLFCSTQTG